MQANPQVAQNMKRAVEIFEKHGNMIRNAIRLHVNDKSILDDILQDFFLALVRRPIPSGIQNIKSYLCRAVKNDVIDAAFQTKNYYARNKRYAESHKDHIPFHNPEDIVIMAETMQNLFGIIEKQLYHHEAEAITQKFRFDWDDGKAADAMGINKRSFSHYLCTGLKKARQIAQQRKLEQNIPA